MNEWLVCSSLCSRVSNNNDNLYQVWIFLLVNELLSSYPSFLCYSVWCDAGDWSVAVFTRDNKEHIMGSFVSIAAC